MKQWPIICSGVFLLIALINPKTRILKIVLEQIKIYKDDRKKTSKCYWFDILTFLIVPACLAVFIAEHLPLFQITSHAGTIITVFSLIATLPLSFLALFIDKILQSEKEKDVAKEAFVSITIDIVYSMIVIAIVIIASFIKTTSTGEIVVVSVISFFVIKIALNILMIIKRVFSIWDKQC